MEEAIRVMSDHDFSQICVTKAGRIIGSLNEAPPYEHFVRDPDRKAKSVGESTGPLQGLA